MSTEPELHLRQTSGSDVLRVKPAPKAEGITVPFSYTPSDDGTDENLLIVLHGLGDTHARFGRIVARFKLPQTASLSIRAPSRVPYLPEEAYQWFNSFDDLGFALQNPNPTQGLEFLEKVVDYLIKECTWTSRTIHFFGYGQGGSLSAEFCLKWWKAHSQEFGSVVTVGGPLLSFPTLKPVCPTPLLIFNRPAPSQVHIPPGGLASFRKGFSLVKEVQPSGDGMPGSRQEWMHIMEFWSQKLSKRPVEEDLYEVMSGNA